MQPAIGIDAQRLAGEVAEVGWFVDALEQRQESLLVVSEANINPSAALHARTLDAHLFDRWNRDGVCL